MAISAPPSHPPHLLVFPWPTQGHINPLMLLAKYMASQGLLITFVHSARNFSLLERATKISAKQVHQPIRFEAIPDGIPTDEKHKPTDDEVLASLPLMEAGLDQLIDTLNNKENPVSCIISDTFLPWTQDVANKFGIPRYEFWTGSSTSYSIGYHLPQLISEGYIPVKGSVEETVIDSIPGVPPLTLADVPKGFLVKDISDPRFQFFFRAFSRTREAKSLLIHSSYDLEIACVNALKADQLAVYSIGPLLPIAASSSHGEPQNGAAASLLPENDGCLKWLDAQARSSVIYVSFGSAASLSAEETQELALGLESSEQPFIWVIRPDSLEGTLSDALPTGFQSRTKCRSLIISWAPQLAVLSHTSVGGFLTHCGWNSTMESLWMGVPMVGCPREAEQRLNMRFIAKEWKAGVELGREEGGGLGRKGVERAVRVLMQGGEEGKEARRGAMEINAILRKGMEVSTRNLDKLVEDMRQLVRGQA